MVEETKSGFILPNVGGDGKSFSHAELVILTQELEVLAMLTKGFGRKQFPPFKRWEGGGGVQEMFYPVLRGQTKFQIHNFSNFVNPPPFK